jgi:hypothetical protein
MTRLLGRGGSPKWFIRRMPGVRQLRCAALRRLTPLNDGRQQGTPVIRFYWAEFLERYRSDFRGDALEIGWAKTIRKYGGKALTRADVIDVAAHTPEVAVVADLTRADHAAAPEGPGRRRLHHHRVRKPVCARGVSNEHACGGADEPGAGVCRPRTPLVGVREGCEASPLGQPQAGVPDRSATSGAVASMPVGRATSDLDVSSGGEPAQ